MRNPADEWTDEEFEKLRKRLEDNYREASEGVMAQLEYMLADYDRHNVEWQARVASGAVSESEYRDWLGRRATDQSIVRYTAESLANDAVNADRKAMDLINNAIPAVYAENANMAAFAIDSALGQDHSFDLYDEDTVRRLMLMDEHDQLIHEFIPVGPPVESLQTLRVDLDAVKDVNWNRQKFTASITQSILQGESIPDAATRLSRVLNMDMNMATRAARTAITGAENAGRVDSYRRAVEMGLKIEQEWMATLDKRTRHSHRAVDGTHVPVGEKFIVGNTELEYPADPKGDPSETYNCRCTLVAWFPDSDQHDSERWSNLPDGMTYDEWKYGRATLAQSIPNDGNPEYLAGVRRGAPMSFDEANELRGNPNYNMADKAMREYDDARAGYTEKLNALARGDATEEELLKAKSSMEEKRRLYRDAVREQNTYRNNCQTTVVANEARRRGYNVEATPNIKGSVNARVSYNTSLAWVDRRTGGRPSYIYYQGAGALDDLGRPIPTHRRYVAWLFEEGTIEEGARYTIEFGWRGCNGGHIVCIERAEGALRMYDPQTGRTYIDQQISEYLKDVRFSRTAGGYKYSVAPSLLKVSDLDFNVSVCEQILREATT